jgi:hypothetical protein
MNGNGAQVIAFQDDGAVCVWSLSRSWVLLLLSPYFPAAAVCLCCSACVFLLFFRPLYVFVVLGGCFVFAPYWLYLYF